MDWIRKMNDTPNISGTNGRLLTVTEEELAKHNKVTDCWTAISGKPRFILRKINIILLPVKEMSTILLRTWIIIQAVLTK